MFGPVTLPPIVVGIGINVNWPEGDTDLDPELVGRPRPCASRPVIGSTLQRCSTPFSFSWSPGLLTWAPTSAARQAADLLTRCTTVGSQVRVELAGETFEGMATGITPDGHLTVDVGDLPRTVVAGDVVHVRPPA